ncbi:MAG: hypothetical protein DRI61_09690 [Chloroflexi bacterium]|nr:MAG: hypothetical protein DRI61_09690 [Chloroflexota bacterium]
MATLPTRTYVENPDGYLDTYHIEDAIRDLAYNTEKLKIFIEMGFPEYPGFIIVPTISRNTGNSVLINISSFTAIDLDRNIIVYDGIAGMALGDIEYDTTYWITARTELTESEDTRKNPQQSNRPYQYIMQENISIKIVGIKPVNELTLGQVSVSLSGDGSQFEVTYSSTDRSDRLLNIQQAFEELNALESDLDSRYVIKERYNPVSKTGGDRVRELTAGQSPADLGIPDPNTLVAGLNSDGYIDPELIDINAVIPDLIESISIPGTGAEGIINLRDIYQEFVIWRNPDKIYGIFRFDSIGDIYEIETSYNVRTGETPERAADADILYITASKLITGKVEVRIRNNFATTRTIKYKAR